MNINLPNSSIIKETAYESLERIANIEDDAVRAQALRDNLASNNALAIVVQRTYHPNYNFDLPEGPLPESVAKKSGHDEYGPFYTSIKKWDILRRNSEYVGPHINRTNKETQFIALYEGVSDKDADLLIAIKDKRLPWGTLDRDFVVDTLPELFPCSFRSSDQEKATQSFSIAGLSAQASTGESKKDTCKRIMRENPGLARKDYIRLFEEVGISKATGGLYYQSLKDVVNA